LFQKTEIHSGSSFIDAFVVWFQSFFVFKATTPFPKELSLTLDFFQRFLFEHHSDGSKSQKKTPSNIARMLSLGSKIEKFKRGDEEDFEEQEVEID
jgi:hypothetical protein